MCVGAVGSGGGLNNLKKGVSGCVSGGRGSVF